MHKPTHVLALGFALAAALRAEAAVEVLHHEFLEPAEPAVAPARRAAYETAHALRFFALGRDFDLDLERNGRLAGLGRQLAADADLIPYRGRLRGAAGSWVRLVRSAAGWSGLIWDGAELIGVDTRAGDGDSARTIVYRLADVYVTPGTLGCGSAAAPTSGAAEFAALVDEFTPLAAAGAEVNLNVGAVADSDFAAAHGANTQAALLTRFNNVDGIFSEQLGIQITVGTLDIMEPGSDPFTEMQADALLDQVAEFRRSDPEQRSQGLTHLFTGKNLNGSTVGIAFVGAVCSTNFGAGLSEGRAGSVIDSLIAAHEIGHNFGAPHDNESGSACESTPPVFLMAPTIMGSDEFSACSVAQMQDEIAGAACLLPIPRADLSPRAVEDDVEIAVGQSVDYVIAVANVGTETATGVTLDATVDAGLDVTAATSDTGLCTAVAGDVDCLLEAIGPGAEALVTLSLASDAAGTYAVAATAGADADANPGNDSMSAAIDVVAATDLSLAGATAAAFEIDEVSRSTFTLANVSDSPANAIVVSITLPAGLAADGATLAGANCDVTPSTVVCNLVALAAQSSVPLALDLRGEAIGNHIVTVEAEAAEQDSNPATNTLSLTVSVTAQPAPAPEGQAGASSSGGGGAAGFFWLMLLALGRSRLCFGEKR